LPIALDTPEPRIHFALVCGAKSCPPIKTYTHENLDEELDTATQAFLEDSKCIVDIERREVSLSMILRWYRIDFGTNNAEMLEWVHHHLPPGKKKTNLRQLLDAGNYRVKFQTYNWDLNNSS
jgi:hypothetical protein